MGTQRARSPHAESRLPIIPSARTQGREQPLPPHPEESGQGWGLASSVRGGTGSKHPGVGVSAGGKAWGILSEAVIWVTGASCSHSGWSL